MEYKAHNHLSGNNPRCDPADFVVGIVLVQIRSINVVYCPEQHSKPIEDEEKELSWESKSGSCDTEHDA
jgi:hypothetical protein